MPIPRMCINAKKKKGITKNTKLYFVISPIVRNSHNVMWRVIRKFNKG